MSTFWYIVLGLVLGVILTPLLLWIAFKLFLRFFLKKLVKAFADAAGAGVPPFRLELEPNPEPDWNNAKLVERITAELERHGFEQAGDYLVFTSAPVTLRSYANVDRGRYAVLYDWDPEITPGFGVTIDIVADTEDGKHFTITNTPETGLDQPDWSNKRLVDVDINNARIAVEAMLERAAELIGDAPLKPVSTEGFAAAFKSAYAREMDWQVERGGLSREEIVRNLVLMQGLEEDDEKIDEVVEMTQSQWKHAIADFICEETRERFLRHVTKMSAGEWEDIRDRVFVVHERSMADTLQEELIDRMVDGEDEDLEDDDAYERRQEEAMALIAPHFDQATPRQAFEAVQAHLPDGKKYKRLARIKSPWPADVYLEPEEGY